MLFSKDFLNKSLSFNSNEYEQYNAGWAKACLLIDFEKDEYDREHPYSKYFSLGGCFDQDKACKLIRNYRAQPNQSENALALIQFYLKNELINVTPESFSYDKELREAAWSSCSKKDAKTVLTWIESKSNYYRNKERQEALEELLEVLQAVYDIESIDDFEYLPTAKKEEKSLSAWYKDYGLGADGRLPVSFDSYEELNNYFLDGLFEEENSRFFLSVPLDTLDGITETEDRLVAIVGLDSSKLVFYWFNY